MPKSVEKTSMTIQSSRGEGAQPLRSHVPEVSGAEGAQERGAAWYTCVRMAQPFDEIAAVPPELKIPAAFVVGVTAAALGGAGLGVVRASGPPLERMAEAIFQGSLTVYVGIAAFDVWEHLRLEKHVTGSYLSSTVVPWPETAIHGAIGATLAGFIQLARPIERKLERRDAFVLLTPHIFLALGWLDELAFHRRRALHREDILHTVSHLSAAALMASLFAARVINWRRLRR